MTSAASVAFFMRVDLSEADKEAGMTPTDDKDECSGCCAKY
jgi:hypothetical protein